MLPLMSTSFLSTNKFAECLPSDLSHSARKSTMGTYKAPLAVRQSSHLHKTGEQEMNKLRHAGSGRGKLARLIRHLGERDGYTFAITLSRECHAERCRGKREEGMQGYMMPTSDDRSDVDSTRPGRAALARTLVSLKETIDPKGRLWHQLVLDLAQSCPKWRWPRRVSLRAYEWRRRERRPRNRSRARLA